MDTLPLPPSPSLENYRKRAKQLVKARASSDPGAVRAWAAEWLDKLRSETSVPLTPFVQASMDRAADRLAKHLASRAEVTLADAQFVIAQAHGFDSWAAFADHIEQFKGDRTAVSTFEQAADAIVGGDIATLRRLLGEDPSLVRARSTREHRATLLHYVAANGVEDFRQRSPGNAVEIARQLLESGAEADALAETYGGGPVQTTMNLLVSSTHPAGAGVKAPLAELLLDFGAAIDGVANDGSPLMTAIMFGYLPAVAALGRRGARVDNIVAAAALGRADLVGRYLADGVHPDTLNGGFTALHMAAAAGHLDIIDLLLRHGASLEIENMYGGTVLGSTSYFAEEQSAPGVDYQKVIERLIAAGARRGGGA
jgi:hypothetical protein